jgi:hypothetical protein
VKFEVGGFSNVSLETPMGTDPVKIALIPALALAGLLTVVKFVLFELGEFWMFLAR